MADLRADDGVRDTTFLKQSDGGVARVVEAGLDTSGFTQRVPSRVEAVGGASRVHVAERENEVERVGEAA